MEIKKFGHIAFNCRNLEKSIAFYRDILGCKEKFRLKYDCFIDEIVKNTTLKRFPEFLLKLINTQRERTWPVYLEFTDGVFAELFDQIGARKMHVPKYTHYNYQHFALIVDYI